ASLPSPASSREAPAAATSEPAPAREPTRVDLHVDDGGGARGRRVTGVVVASAGVGLAAAGVVTYLVGSSKLNAINQDAAAHAPYNPANGNYKQLGAIGVGLAIAGGAAVATGAILYLVNGAPQAEGGGARISFDYLPGAGGQVRIGGR